MNRLVALGATLGAVLACVPARAEPVRTTDHDSFFLWAGTPASAPLRRARTLYILQGQVNPPRADGPAWLEAQGGAIPIRRGGQIWLVYRAGTLRWPEPVYRAILARYARWREQGDPVVGVQIDFDAGTRHLGEYAAFLRDLRARLPPGCRLGVTGLLDWSSRGDPAGLAELAGVVDDLVLQTYQGRATIAGYEAYLARLDRLPLPFKIGLVEGGEWRAPASLLSNKNFRGYVVFPTGTGPLPPP